MAVSTGVVARSKAWLRRNSLGLITIALVLSLLFVYLAPNIFIFIYSGHAGVLWSRLSGGTDIDTVYQEGIHIIFPWDIMHIYNIRLQEKGETFGVLSKDGLSMDVDVTVRYQPIEQDLGRLHKYIGPSYVATLLLPEVRAHMREQIAQYTPQELYSEQRQNIQQAILAKVQEEMLAKYHPESGRESFVHLEDVFIKGITLPTIVQDAIENKLAQLHQMLEYEYRIAKEKKEAERKEIEARGIRAFQDAISQSIDENYLKWKGIDATLKLAGSENAKIVIIGAGEDGLPIILGGFDSSQAAKALPPAPVQPAPRQVTVPDPNADNYPLVHEPLNYPLPSVNPKSSSSRTAVTAAPQQTPDPAEKID